MTTSYTRVYVITVYTLKSSDGGSLQVYLIFDRSRANSERHLFFAKSSVQESCNVCELEIDFSIILKVIIIMIKLMTVLILSFAEQGKRNC